MLRPRESSEIRFTAIMCYFRFSIQAASLEPFLPVFPANLTGTELKRAFPDVLQPAGSTYPGNKGGEAGEQSVLYNHME